MAVSCAERWHTTEVFIPVISTSASPSEPSTPSAEGFSPGYIDERVSRQATFCIIEDSEVLRAAWDEGLRKAGLPVSRYTLLGDSVAELLRLHQAVHLP